MRLSSEGAIRFNIGRGMSRRQAEINWGRDAVLHALGGETPIVPAEEPKDEPKDIPGRRLWSEQDDRTLALIAELGGSPDDAAKAIGRSPCAIRQRARMKGVRFAVAEILRVAS